MSALSHLYSDRIGRGGLRQGRFYRQSLAALAVSVAAGLAIFATTAGSLLQGAIAAPPAMKSPPPGWIDIAFAQVDSAQVDAAWLRSAVQSQQMQVTQSQNTQKQEMQKQNTGKQDTQKKDPCADFVYYFLNKSCSVKRVSSARRDGFTRRAVAARTMPAPAPQVTARNSDRVTLAATTTTVTD